ncbi:pilus assembly protein TadG-related protein [Rothia sp. CCM 9417]|uniref:pilus assembly protein TadG-related protein n=1 Tax=unclassified Rothia (in: high G+C Gram-positive bacteria) TaxID=2689056 RepID=UPI003ADA34C2
MIALRTVKVLTRAAFCSGKTGGLEEGPRALAQYFPFVRSTKSESERGSVLIFIVGLCLVLLLVASTVVGVSSVYLERHRLQSLADQAATSAAQRVEGISAASESEALIHLNSATVTSTTQTFLTESGAAGDFSNLALSPGTGVSGNNTAVVVLSASAHPPLLSIVVPDGVNITVTGKARARATQGQ